jgi:hypothetical protein
LTTRPPRKTTPRRRTVPQDEAGGPRRPQDRRAKATVTDLVDGPIQALDLDAEPAYDPQTAARVHLFTLHGVDYYVDAEPRANVSLQFMRRYRTDPVDAQAWLLEELLGADAYTALMEWDGLTTAHLAKLTGILEQLAMGGVEDATRPLGGR